MPVRLFVGNLSYDASEAELRQPVVVREDDDLPRLGGGFQHAGEPVERGASVVAYLSPPRDSLGRQLPKICLPVSRAYFFTRFQVCQICPDPAFVPNSLGTDKFAGSKQILYWSGPSNS